MPYSIVPAPSGSLDINGVGTAILGTTVDIGTDHGNVFPVVTTILRAVQENLKTLFSTRIGERQYQPTYGTDLYRAVFEPNNAALKQQIDSYIRVPIQTWLPYVQIETLDIVTNEDDPTLNHFVRINLDYTIDNFNVDSIVIFINDTGTVTVVTGN